MTWSAVRAQNSCESQLDSVRTYINDTTLLFAQSKEIVPLQEAVMKTYLYNLWCKSIPEKIVTHHWDSLNKTYELSFDKVTLRGESAALLRNLLEQYYAALNDSNVSQIPDTLNFSFNTEARSYFIKQSDIAHVFTDSTFKNSLNAINENPNFVNVEKGIRVYIGVQNIQPNNERVTASHIYVVPQIKYVNRNRIREFIYQDVYVENPKGQPSVLDLTTPCPNACGTNNSVLNWQRSECSDD